MSMTPGELAEWRSRHRAAADALDRVDLEEIAELTDAEALARTRSLRLFGSVRLPTSSTSGLVEQQALFHGLPPP